MFSLTQRGFLPQKGSFHYEKAIVRILLQEWFGIRDHLKHSPFPLHRNDESLLWNLCQLYIPGTPIPMNKFLFLLLCPIPATSSVSIDQDVVISHAQFQWTAKMMITWRTRRGRTSQSWRRPRRERRMRKKWTDDDDDNDDAWCEEMREREIKYIHN